MTEGSSAGVGSSAGLRRTGGGEGVAVEGHTVGGWWIRSCGGTTPIQPQGVNAVDATLYGTSAEALAAGGR